jgi:Loader and inhibitor of phage G40P
MTSDEAVQVVALALAAYPTQAGKISGNAIAAMRAMWADLLSDLEFETVKAALRVYCRSAKWLPSPAELREIAATGGAHVRPGGDAWGDVRALHSPTLKRPGCSVHRYPREHEVEDPIVWRCIKAIGWVALCDSENPVADRARFIELYDKTAAAARHAKTAGVEALKGLREATATPAQSLAGDLAKLLTSENRTKESAP